MKTIFARLFLVALLVAVGTAKENIPGQPKVQLSGKTFRTAASCLPASSSSELNINNVRALLHNGGDMWWDLVSQAKYEVPKVSNPANARHAIFSGSLWVGGIDNSGLLRIAAQTYRQGGNDFWPGPLRITGTGDTEQDICKKWDKHFRINKTEIDKFRTNGEVSQTIANWPAINEDAAAGDFEKFLAPFHDENNDQDYNPADGDYPIVTIASCNTPTLQREILPDQFIWWIINDNGDLHTETGGQPIGLEIHMTAFAFTTSNSINEMTFYQEKVYNRSTLTLNNTYMGQWTDADMGNAFDDFAGCDTIRGLAFVYNADNDDSPLAIGYGAQPPAIGIDFFQGPMADPDDERDNDGDKVVDEEGERILMSRFVYYNNDFSLTGNPSQATHFYNYLIGKWKDGAFMVDDREPNSGVVDGYPNSGDLPGTLTQYMFPDYPGVSCSYEKYNGGVAPYGEWGEYENGIKTGKEADKRLLQSAGPFTLRPGAFNELIVGVVWTRDQANAYDVQQFGSVCKMLQADDIAQALFDACFDLLDGPDAPDLAIEEYDRQLILTWKYNNTASNNYYENYSERDPILCQANPSNCRFDFEGYMVYQLKDATVTPTELDDATKARLIAQCDVKNGVSTIVNRETQNIAGLNEPVITDKIMVNGADNGLFHSLVLNTDAFATGSDEILVNYRTYYFTIVAYAYNDTSTDGRKFIRGNSNVVRYEATPHKTSFENFGTVLNSEYGTGPEITRISGRGNNGNFLKLNEATEAAALQSPYIVSTPTYASGFGPLNVKVVNPKSVLGKQYEIEIPCDSLLGIDARALSLGNPDSANYSDWMLYDVTNSGQRDLIYQSIYRADNMNPSAYANRAMNGQEKLIVQNLGGGQLLDHGFSIGVQNSYDAGDTTDTESGFIGADVQYADPTRKWLDGLPDQDNFPTYNWIRSGSTPRDALTSTTDVDLIDYYGWNGDPQGNVVKEFIFYDKNESFENVLNGTWSPYIMTASFHTTKDLIAPRVKVFFHDGASPNAGGQKLYANINPNFEMDPANVVTLNELPNIDVVITSDQNKWSRCVVVETSPSKNLGSGSWVMTAKWRNNMSLQDINNCTPASIPTSGATDYGMSYFPGYAIDLDSGRRLNIFFGESTWHKNEHGDDMLWNPTGNLGNDGKAIGGRHYLYVSNTTYDECAALASSLRVPVTASRVDNTPTGGADRPLRFVGGYDIANAWKDVAWANIPLVTQQQNVFRCYSRIPTDVRIRLRVKHKMECGARFRFDMRPFAVETNNTEAAEESMNIIRIVPNPYYGRSGVSRGRYEETQIDTRVKLTNLPTKCTVRIFTLNGALVRTFNKDSEEPDQEWDLKNDYGVPIASGLYIIHIDGKSLGEKVLKFFCVMPQPDLNAY